jgi:hypothetical protein
MSLRTACLTVAALLPLIVSGGTALSSEANEKPGLSIELNRLDANADSCRTTFVIRNDLGAEIRALTFEIVLFDKDQKLLRLTSFPAGAFPKGKTIVQQFDIPGIVCGTIGRALLNAISQCDGEGLDPARCLAGVRTMSRAGVDLVY